MPAGSRPLVGSSRIASSGPAERSGYPEPLLHPQRVGLDGVLCAVAEAHELQRLGDPAPVDRAEAAKHLEVARSRQRRVKRRRLDQRADLRQVRSRVAIGSPRTSAVPEVGRISPSSIWIVVALPAPLGPTKPLTRPDGGSMSCLRPRAAVVVLGGARGSRRPCVDRANTGPRCSFGCSGRVVAWGRCRRRQPPQATTVILSAMNFARDVVDGADPAGWRSIELARDGRRREGRSGRSPPERRARRDGARARASSAATS